MSQNSKGMSGIQVNNRGDETAEWLTPPEILNVLGTFDLDPCASTIRPWPTAKRHIVKEENGLAQPWDGRVWMNPPYGTQTRKWMQKLALHGNGIALIFARVETKMFQHFVWDSADAVFFLFDRLFFYKSNGEKAPNNAGAPSCLVAYGQENVRVLEHCGLSGQLIYLNR